MATPKTKISPEELEALAYEYIDECLENKKESHIGSHIVKVKDRHIPTIEYFLRIWIPKEGKPSITRTTYYNWLNYSIPSGTQIDQLKGKDKERAIEHKNKFDTIKNIKGLFGSLATDIVANEGKGIFYAKNRLGMTDRQEISGNAEQPLFGPGVNKK